GVSVGTIGVGVRSTGACVGCSVSIRYTWYATPESGESRPELQIVLEPGVWKLGVQATSACCATGAVPSAPLKNGAVRRYWRARADRKAACRAGCCGISCAPT